MTLMKPLLPLMLVAPTMAQAQIGAAMLPHDLSPLGMFRAADPIVQGVMLGLVAASVVTWTVLVVKSAELWLAGRRLRQAAALIGRADSLDHALTAAAGRRDPGAHLLHLAAEERARSGPSDAALTARVASLLSGAVAEAGRAAAVGTGLLATIGAVAPFVGLFGTVWGIMNAFIGISQAQTTNLAVVAPGIAEALLATALGLVAAIPAVVFYNLLARAITGYRLRLSHAAAAVERLLSRDIDRAGG